jgi:hypothetical protein
MNISSIGSISSYRVIAAHGSYLQMAQMINSSDANIRAIGITEYKNLITNMRATSPIYGKSVHINTLGSILDIYC